jgi:hypothetical protein
MFTFLTFVALFLVIYVFHSMDIGNKCGRFHVFGINSKEREVTFSKNLGVD